EDVNRITHLNAMENFRYDPFAHIPRDQATVGALRARATDVDTTPVSHGTGKFQDEGLVTAMTLAERVANHSSATDASDPLAQYVTRRERPGAHCAHPVGCANERRALPGAAGAGRHQPLLLDVRGGRPAAVPALRGLRLLAAPARPPLPQVRQPGAGTGGRERRGRGVVVHGQPPVVGRLARPLRHRAGG